MNVFLNLYKDFTCTLHDFMCMFLSATVQDVEFAVQDVEFAVQDVEFAVQDVKVKGNPVNLTAYSYWRFFWQEHSFELTETHVSGNNSILSV